MAINITPTSAPLGAVITDLDVDNLTAEQQRELYDAWLQYGVLVFKRTVSTHDHQMKLSRVFGETVLHPVEYMRIPEEPMLIKLAANEGKTVAPNDPTGDDVIGQIPWHVDLMYTDLPTRGALLRSIIIPIEGGDTGFIDTARLYATLPKEIKARIQGVRIVHSYNKAHLAQNMVKGSSTLFPDVIHPLVYVHPDNGLPVLNISPTSAKRLIGLPESEGKELLDYLIEHATRDEEVYRHVWELGDVVLWDNWRTMHRAYGHLKKHPRVMYRTTLKSEMRTGEYLAA
jgi:taurine dioxygenase